MNYAELLQSGVKQLHISLNEAQLNALLRFVELLQKWNKTYNLTAIEGSEEIINKHILDSLTVATYLKGKRIIDVGSGAGLPGIPLAIAHKDKEFLLLDANAKKARFIQQTIIEVGLKNAQVVQQRVEQFAPAHEFDTVVSRAFAASERLIESIDHLVSQGQVIVMLGKRTQLQHLPQNYSLIGIYAVHIPNLYANRHIAVIKKKAGNG